MLKFLINHPALTICSASLFIFICTFIYYLIKINGLKKSLLLQGKNPSKKTSSYIGSIILTFAVEVLPFLIPLRIFVLTIICACGILGEIIIFRERISTI